MKNTELIIAHSRAKDNARAATRVVLSGADELVMLAKDGGAFVACSLPPELGAEFGRRAARYYERRARKIEAQIREAEKAEEAERNSGGAAAATCLLACALAGALSAGLAGKPPRSAPPPPAPAPGPLFILAAEGSA